MKNKLKVFFLVGPTCSGKSRIAIELCKKYPFEIICMDSATIYEDLNIGTDKPCDDILANFKHHIINIRKPDQSYNVNSFYKDAQKAINKIFSRNKMPLIVGGTMMYFNRLIYGLDSLPKNNITERRFISYLFDYYGIEKIYDSLEQLDPSSYSRINSNDKQRIERALEVFILTGKPMSSFFGDTGGISNDFIFNTIFLTPNDRGLHNKKITDRTKKMFDRGLIEEVQDLKARYSLSYQTQSMRSIGYREVMKYLDGDLPYDDLIQRSMISTRQFAKRQLTWMKRFHPDLNINIDHKEDRDIIKDIETNLHLI